MDDNELDSLFGNLSESDKEALKEENRVMRKLADEKKIDLNGATEDKKEPDVDSKEPDEDKKEADEDKKEPDEDRKESKEDKSENGDPDEATEEKPKEKREPVRQKTQSFRDSIPLSGKSIFAIVLAVAVVVMVILVMFLPAFRVRNVQVEGNIAISDQDLLAAAGLEYDAHLMSGVSGNIFDILKLDYGKTEDRIMKENPYIEDIRITIKLPSTVEIKVKERSKICYIRTPDGYAALDKDGIVLELSSFDSRKDVRPVICGLNIKYAELGKPVTIENYSDYKKAIVVLGAIIAADNASVGGNYSMFENTSEVRILPSGYIFLTIYSPSGKLIQIKLNSTDSIGDDMAWLLYAFNADAFDRVTIKGSLDMTNDEYIFNEYT